MRRIEDDANDRGFYERRGRDYQYNENGNVTYDPNRDVYIKYNLLDLPVTIRWGSPIAKKRLELTYDAGGTLLTRKQIDGNDTELERRDYVGGIEYANLQIESVHHEEGRLWLADGDQHWDYALKDHLGNTRLLYSDLDGDGRPEVPDEIIQENHYYPFGMRMEGPWMRHTSPSGGQGGDSYAYQYNGIEHVDAFELNVNMAFYRTLDPVTGRWWQVDPKAEKFGSLSPYNSMGNSPGVNVDPHGDDVEHRLVRAAPPVAVGRLHHLTRPAVDVVGALQLGGLQVEVVVALLVVQQPAGGVVVGRL